MYKEIRHAGKPRMLYHLPASLGAVIDLLRPVTYPPHPGKPERMMASLRLKEGLKEALLGEAARFVDMDSLKVFYLN